MSTDATAVSPIDCDILAEAVAAGASRLGGNDAAFFRRVWATDLDIYRRRLNAIDFRAFDRVLDAGCGVGQWTFCLAHIAAEVCAVDYNHDRVEAARTVLQKLGQHNVSLSAQSVEAIGYPDAHFDAIFCYSVLPLTNYRKTLSEYARLLRPGGKLYACSNGLGWYLFKFITNHNASPHYRPRRNSAMSVLYKLRHVLTGRFTPGHNRELMISSRTVKRFLQKHGFDDVLIGGEGTLNLNNADTPPRSFYRSAYLGMECVYEVLATKSH